MTRTILPFLFSLLFANLVQGADSVPANFTEQMLFADDPKEWLTISRVSQPTYPKELFAAGVTGYVDVKVAIDPFGGIKRIGAISSNPVNPQFEQSVRESVSHWRFKGKLTDACTPQDSEGNVRVWFEITEGKEKVSISTTAGTLGTKIPKAGEPVWLKMLNEKEVRSRVVYPDRARREDLMAAIYAVMSVNSATGEVQDVEISHSIPDSPKVKSIFKPPVVNALKTARFEPSPNYAGKPVKVCMPILFYIIS